MENKLVSVIMPVYNVEKYVVQAINSIIEQSYNNWELIIVDDGSTDNSPQICDKFAEKHPNIHVFHIKNNGVGNARNFGIINSSGEYITFVDSDDALDKEFLKILINNASLNGSDIVVCNYKSIGTNFANATNDIDEDYQVLDSGKCLKDFLDNKFYTYVIWGKLYKRAVIEDLKFRNMKIGEDTCFIIDLLQKNVSISFLKYQGYVYRAREDGITKIKEFGDKDLDRIRIARIFFDTVRDKQNELRNLAKDKVFYTFVSVTKELLKNNTKTILEYHDLAIQIIEGIDYKDTTIGLKKKIYISLFINASFLAKQYASLFL